MEEGKTYLVRLGAHSIDIVGGPYEHARKARAESRKVAQGLPVQGPRLTLAVVDASALLHFGAAWAPTQESEPEADPVLPIV